MLMERTKEYDPPSDRSPSMAEEFDLEVGDTVYLGGDNCKRPRE